MAAWMNIWEHLPPSGSAAAPVAAIVASACWVKLARPQRFLRAFFSQMSVFHAVCGGLHVVRVSQAWPLLGAAGDSADFFSFFFFSRQHLTKTKVQLRRKIHAAVHRVRAAMMIIFLNSIRRLTRSPRTPPLAPCTPVPTEGAPPRTHQKPSHCNDFCASVSTEEPLLFKNLVSNSFFAPWLLTPMRLCLPHCSYAPSCSVLRYEALCKPAVLQLLLI